MSITYQVESVMRLKDELTYLINAHRDEVGAFTKSKFPLVPAWDLYRVLDDKGSYVLYTARTPEGELVGYAGYILQVMLHYKENNIAANDVLFLHPSLRKGLTGYRLLKYSIDDLKKQSNIDCIQVSMKTKHCFDAIVQRLGFTHTDQVYHMEV